MTVFQFKKKLCSHFKIVWCEILSVIEENTIFLQNSSDQQINFFIQKVQKKLKM